MNDAFFVILNTVASIIIIVCNVLSLNLLFSISNELKGLKTMDTMWHYFMIMTTLFILLGIARAIGAIGTVIFEGFQPIFDALVSVVPILYFAFAILLSISIEEITG